MPNIKFNYLYRDSINYKNFGYVVFDNASNYPLTELEAIIRSKLIDGTWFYAAEWQLPELFFDSLTQADPTWHEFENLTYTEEPVQMIYAIIQGC